MHIPEKVKAVAKKHTGKIMFPHDMGIFEIQKAPD
jgi:hypothetical protein